MRLTKQAFPARHIAGIAPGCQYADLCENGYLAERGDAGGLNSAFVPGFAAGSYATTSKIGLPLEIMSGRPWESMISLRGSTPIR